MMLVGGCYYIEPVWQPPQNTAPVIQTRNPVDTVVFNQSITRVTVLASDPEGDLLDFQWIPPFGAEFSTVTAQNASGVYRSDCDLVADSILDGETLLLTITDAFPGDPKTTEVFWALEVP